MECLFCSGVSKDLTKSDENVAIGCGIARLSGCVHVMLLSIFM